MNPSTLPRVNVASLAKFVGQARAKNQITVAMTAAARRGTRMPHMVFAGPAGTGKSTLAMLVAAACGRKVLMLSGKITAEDLLEAIDANRLTDGDFVFIDEAHLLVAGGTAAAEAWFLHALHDRMIARANGTPIMLPDLTYLLATTDLNDLPTTFRDRIKVRIDLAEYALTEATEIVFQAGVEILTLRDGLPLPSVTQVVQIAEAANRNPRLIRTMLETLADLTLATSALDTITRDSDPDEVYSIPALLAHMQITADGLNADARKYLITLAKQPKGTAGANTVSSLIGVKVTSLREVERVLMNKNMLTITGKGRMLTDVGATRATELAQTAAETDLGIVRLAPHVLTGPTPTQQTPENGTDSPAQRVSPAPRGSTPASGDEAATLLLAATEALLRRFTPVPH